VFNIPRLATPICRHNGLALHIAGSPPIARMIASKLSSTGTGRFDILPCGSGARRAILNGFHVDSGVIFDRRIGVFQLGGP